MEQNVLFRNSYYCNGEKTVHGDFFFGDGACEPVNMEVSSGIPYTVYNNVYIFPGFADVHVHLREPGFSYKETIASGTAAAAAGGYTSVLAMPNLNPVPDCKKNLERQLEIISRDAAVNVYPYGAITKGEKGGELADMEELAPYVAGFSDDGRGVADPFIMEAAMKKAAKLGKVIAAHCEDMAYVNGGCIREGSFSRTHGLKGIQPESEWRQVERDIELVKKTGCAYHVCHVSTAGSVALIRKAKSEGLDITCETAPHYLMLTENDLTDDGSFKMNPPLGSEADRDALLEGIADGTVDMVATDHAPHSAEEKSRGLKDSAFGIVGLETAFPVLYTGLVASGIITLERLVTLMSAAPARRFPIKQQQNTFTVFGLSTEYTVDPSAFVSKGRATPFAGKRVRGKCIMTVINGRTVYR